MTGSGYDEEGGRRVVAPPSLTVVEERDPRPAEQVNLTVSVVICAYTEDRWPLLLRSVASVQHQNRTPVELIVCVDHNDSLLERCRLQWGDHQDIPSVPVVVIANRYQGRLGSARNSAAEVARGDIVAFLDDDAWAEPDWLDRLVSPYGDESVVAVGGAPVPEFEGRRPGWFPFEFDWVFGCAYSGLPEQQAPVARLIGANMSVRRSALAEIGGFHSDNHDDMDMCHRLTAYASRGTDRLRTAGTGPPLRSGGTNDLGLLLASLLLREQGKGRGLPPDGRSGQFVRRRRLRAPSAVPWRL